MATKNLEERREINKKATAIVREMTRITSENRQKFEAIVREMNKNLDGVKKVTIKWLKGVLLLWSNVAKHCSSWL